MPGLSVTFGIDDEGDYKEYPSTRLTKKEFQDLIELAVEVEDFEKAAKIRDDMNKFYPE